MLDLQPNLSSTSAPLGAKRAGFAGRAFVIDRTAVGRASVREVVRRGVRRMAEHAFEKAPPAEEAIEPGARLVASVRAGEPGASAALFDRYGAYVERILVRVLGHSDPDLEDLLQDVFVECFASLDRLADPTRFKPWLAQITVFTARSAIRRRRRRRWLTFLAPSEVPERASMPTDHGDRQLVDRMYRALDTLPADERIAFSLRFLEQMTVAEAAEAAGVSQATFKRRLSRAREAVHRALGVDPSSNAPHEDDDAS